MGNLKKWFIWYLDFLIVLFIFPLIKGIVGAFLPALLAYLASALIAFLLFWFFIPRLIVALFGKIGG